MTDAVGFLDSLLGTLEQAEDDRVVRPGRKGRASRGRSGPSGLVADTPVLTPDGARPVQALRPGDLVVTCDNGFVPLVRIRHRDTSQHWLSFEHGALGAHEAQGVAERQLILVQSKAARLCFGAAELLVPARALMNVSSVQKCDGQTRKVWCLETQRQEIVFVNGLRLATLAMDRAAPTARTVLTQSEARILNGSRWML